MKKVRILITGGGAPGYPLFFKAMRASTKYDFFLCSTEINQFKGNLFHKDWIDKVYIISPVSSESYLKQLLSIIRENKIKIIFSGIDEELAILAKNRDIIESLGCTFVLPSVRSLDISFNKWESYKYCKNLVSQPRTLDGESFLNDENAFNSFSKPFKLKASKTRGNRNNYSIYTENDFLYYKNKFQDIGEEFIAQEFIHGSEFNVSLALTKYQNPVYSICREKLDHEPNTMAGAIRRNSFLEEKSIELAKKIGLYPGFSNFEYIRDEKGEYFLIDINGGRHAAQDYNLIASGINLADILCDLAFEDGLNPIDTSNIEDNVICIKYIDELVVSEEVMKDRLINLVDINNKN